MKPQVCRCLAVFGKHAYTVNECDSFVEFKPDEEHYKKIQELCSHKYAPHYDESAIKDGVCAVCGTIVDEKACLEANCAADAMIGGKRHD